MGTFQGGDIWCWSSQPEVVSGATFAGVYRDSFAERKTVREKHNIIWKG